MTDQALKKLEDQLQCSICLDTYKEPKLLQCFHVYCRDCLVKVVVKDQQGTLSISCPICRQDMTVPSKGVSGLQPAFHINHLLEIRDDLRKVKTSPSSSQEDVGHGASELDVESLRDVEAGSATLFKQNVTVYCSEHKQRELELFCESCNRLVCLRCVVDGGVHHSHSFGEVDQVFENYKEEIAALIKPMESKLMLVASTIKQLDACDREVQAHDAALMTSIHESTKHLHEVIEARRIELLIQLSKLTQSKLDSNAAQRDELGIVEAQMKSCLEFMSECLKTGSQEEVLSMRVPIVAKVERLTDEFQKSSLDRTVEAADVVFLISPDLPSMCQGFGRLSAQYHACGNGLKEAVVGEKSTATVRTSILDDQHEGDDTSVKCKCTLISEITGSQVVVKVELLGSRNQYKISYRPTEKGRHRLKIVVDRKHITGSPFSVAVRPSPDGKIETSLRTIDKRGGPCGVVFNNQGKVVITENDKHCVSMFDLDGSYIHTFGTQGSGIGQLLYPRGLAVTSKGEFVIADSCNHRISIFTHDGHFVGVVGTEGDGPLQFSNPKGVAWNPKTGQIYIVDSNHRVQILNSDFTFSSFFGKAGKRKGNFNDPYGIACDSAGRVYVADTMNDRVQIFTSNGCFLREIVLGDGTLTHYPVGVAIDHNNLVYVSEYWMHRVVVYTSKGSFVTSFGRLGTSPIDFRCPRGLAVDQSGVVCVCDYDNNRVSLF